MIKVCWICVVISTFWLAASVGIAFGWLTADRWLLPVAVAMGGSVVGIAYQGERRISWARRRPFVWKLMVTVVGLPLAYYLASQLSKTTVLIEFAIMFLLAYFLFYQAPAAAGDGNTGQENRVEQIKEQMKSCC